MSRVLFIVGSLALVVSFQNCQKSVTFGGSDTMSKASGELGPVTTADNEGNEVRGEGDENEPREPQMPASAVTNYVCILESGSGDSVKLGLVNNKVAGDNTAVSQALCMTQSACLDIASKKFQVRSAESKGYCRDGGNPNVVHISDADLAAKILE